MTHADALALIAAVNGIAWILVVISFVLSVIAGTLIVKRMD